MCVCGAGATNFRKLSGRKLQVLAVGSLADINWTLGGQGNVGGHLQHLLQGVRVCQAKAGEGVPGRGRQVCPERHKTHVKECQKVVSGVEFKVRQTGVWILIPPLHWLFPWKLHEALVKAVWGRIISTNLYGLQLDQCDRSLKETLDSDFWKQPMKI